MAPNRRKHANSATRVIPGGFTELSLKFDSDTKSEHKLYVKEHKVRAEKSSYRPLDRTLFVLNIPPYCSKDVVEELFSNFGVVTSVELSEHPSSLLQPGPELSTYFKPPPKQCFNVGYIVFESASSIAAAKRHPHDVPLVVCSTERTVQTGVSKWIKQYTDSFVKEETLQKEVDDFMKDFDQKEEEEKERQKEEEEQQKEDEEGWVKVGKWQKGKKARQYSEAANEKILQKEEMKKKRKELLNFYSWQHKNNQKEHIAELRKKFEEDKQRIALLRAQRKFKPY
ncbi:ribosomal RNA-processing protein 7 homolog A [Stigmatopora nigra]